MRFRSLYGRIAAIFAVLILLFGGLCGGLDLIAAQKHQQEIVQRLSRGLAEHIAGHWPLMKDNEVDDKAVAELFHMLMIVNPSIELYLLGRNGEILSYDAPPGRVQSKQVKLEAIRAFLAGEALPLKGDNPRNPERPEIFSAAPLLSNGATVGYLYIVLSGDEYRRLAAGVWQSHVVQTALLTGAGALVLTLMTGLGLFFLVTRRLNALTRSIAAFDDTRFDGVLNLPAGIEHSPDEIGRLAATFSRMAERIAAQLQQIKAQDELRRQMVANVSHDLRTPLTSMQGYLETMQRKSAELSPEETANYLQIAVQQSRRVAHLADELFELAKLECEEVQPNFERFALQDLIQDVVQKYELAATAKQVRIGARFIDPAPWVYADIGMIERVLSNLIDNALRHTPEGGAVALMLQGQTDDFVRVRVIDTGTGIPDQLLSGLFERESPLRRMPSKHQGGGLGLLIAKRILQLHGGMIQATSRVGQGSTLEFDLPVAPLPSHSSPESSPNADR